MLKRVAIGIALICLTGLYIVGAMRHARDLNVDFHRDDQETYLNYAIGIATNPGYIGPRNQMPMIPWMLSFLYEPDMSKETLFQQGKMLCISLSCVLLVAIGLVFWRQMPRLLASNMFLAAAFSVFLLKAGYVQADLMFYTMLFLTFVAMLHMLERPSWWYAVAIGGRGWGVFGQGVGSACSSGVYGGLHHSSVKS